MNTVNDGLSQRRAVAQRLRAGQQVHGVMLSSTTSPDFAVSARPEFVIVEREHSPLSLSDQAVLLRMLNLYGILTLVRISEIRYAEISRALDAGADGVLVPRIRTFAELECVIESARLPPVGRKGVGGYDFAKPDLEATLSNYSADKLIILQVENQECIANLDAMLLTGEVSAVIVGPFDLSIDLGHPAQFTHPSFTSTVAKALEIATSHGVPVGMLMSSTEMAIRWRAAGMSIMWLGTEVSIFAAGYDAWLTKLRDSSGQ